MVVVIETSGHLEALQKENYNNWTLLQQLNFYEALREIV